MLTKESENRLVQPVEIDLNTYSEQAATTLNTLPFIECELHVVELLTLLLVWLCTRQLRDEFIDELKYYVVNKRLKVAVITECSHL